VRLLVVNWQDIENPLAGGAEIHLHEIFERLAAAGHEVTMLCGGWPGCPPRATIGGMDVHRTGIRQTFALKAWAYYRRHLARQSFDVLVEDINKMPLYTPYWGARRVVAVVPHLFGGTAFQELSAPLASAVWLTERPIPFVYADTPFEAISESTADDLVARGLRREQVRVVYPGASCAYYTPDAAQRSPTPVFAYLGRLKKYKGVDLVIRAFAQVADQRAVLEIAGEGDFRPVLEQLVASLDLTARVRFLGYVREEEKLALLRRAWATAFASPKEGWGLTNIEASACGTPVVASDSPGIRESVRHGETGYLVRHGDTAAMAEALQRLCDSPALVASLGTRGRAFAESFTWERAADETAAHLQQVIRSGG